MEYLFQTILQLSFYGSIAILIVMLFRLATKKLPKQISCILWAIAGLRLICPFSFRSPLSVLNLHFLQKYSNTTELFHPTANPHAHNVPGVTQAGQALENVTTVSTMASTNDAVQATSSINMFKIMAIIWFVVMVLLFTYTVVKTIHAAYKLRDSERLSRHVYISDQINSPFVLGIFSPKIYMPLGLSKNEWDYLYLHERTHLDKLDHITKLFAISILYVHWFNPLVWIAFNMLCNDIEMRCDEEVLRSKGPDAKREYSLMLVNYASKSEAENYQVIPVGFAKKSLGGIEIKTRVKNIIHYKKTPKIIVAFTFVLSLISTLLLSANTNVSANDNNTKQANVAEQTDTTTLDSTESTEEKVHPNKSFYQDVSADDSNLTVPTEDFDSDATSTMNNPAYADYFNLFNDYTLSSTNKDEFLPYADSVKAAYRFDDNDNAVGLVIFLDHDFQTISDLRSYIDRTFYITDFYDDYSDSDNIANPFYQIYAGGPASDCMIYYYPNDNVLILQSSAGNLR